MSSSRNNEFLRQITGERPSRWRKWFPGPMSGNAALWLVFAAVLVFGLLALQNAALIRLPFRLELWPSFPGAPTQPAPGEVLQSRRTPLVLDGVTNGQLQLTIVDSADAQTIVMGVTGVLPPTNRPASQALGVSGPVQSPDGSSLAFVARIGVSDSVVVAAATGWSPVTPPVLTGGLIVSQESFLAWSPDGGSLAFTAQAEDAATSRSALFVYTLADSALTQMTFSGGWITDPLWIDHERLAYVETAQDGSVSLLLQAIKEPEADQLFSLHAQP